ncbi:MAG: HAD-IA family hydrolase [Acidithiobacillus sp.]
MSVARCDRPSLLVFDWDGTLMDSIALICRCLEAAFAYAGLPGRTEADYRSIIGLGLNDALARLAPEADTTACERILEGYRRCYFAADPEDTPLFPGVEDSLRSLREAGFTLAVATGKARRGLDRALAAHPSLGSLFAVTRCADETRSKPHPQMLQEILAATGTAAGAAWMIGDTVHDVAMARAAGVAALGVSCGVDDVATLMREGAFAVLSGPTELPRFLQAL